MPKFTAELVTTYKSAVTIEAGDARLAAMQFIELLNSLEAPEAVETSSMFEVWQESSGKRLRLDDLVEDDVQKAAES